MMEASVSIEYCNIWNYFPKASSLEAFLKSNFENINVQLISSGGGVFEVKFNQNLIFSKKSLNRFPENSEIYDLIQKELK